MSPADDRHNGVPGLRGASLRLPAMPQDIAADQVAVATVYHATREALRATTPAEVVAIARRLVEELGGWTVTATTADAGVLPMDLSFGVGPPVLAAADPLSVAWLRLSRLLPAFLEDARHLVQSLRVHQVVQRDASIDALTGLVARRVVEAALLGSVPGDVVILIDLDHFKLVNDQHGHAVGDEVLTSFARLLRSHVRSGDVCGRYGGEELLVLQPATDPGAASDRLLAIREEWRLVRPVSCTFSAGVAQIDAAGPRLAFAAADAALYRAKEGGRDQIRIARPERLADLSSAMPPQPTEVRHA